MTLEAAVMAAVGIGKPAPPEYMAFMLCDRFKWTWDYVRALPLPVVLMLLTISSAEAKASKHG